MINKSIKGQINKPYFFYNGRISNINSKYFIKKIDEGCSLNTNNSFKTNVKGEMTSYSFFNKDKEFLKILFQFFDIIDEDKRTEGYILNSSWGIKNNFSHYTKEHNHEGSYFAGVIYLNSHTQLLEFPEINEVVKPEIGAFAVFSSFLKHKCRRNVTDKIKYALSFNCNYHNEF